jgi:hypothetical protein
MRTKTLLLVAAVAAAGVATSMAQVYSVNAVGYVNTTIPKGAYAIISNPLTAATNTINALFPAIEGIQVYVYHPGKGYDVGAYDSLSGSYQPDSVGTNTLTPGQGVFVRNGTASDQTITFVGEVPQGTLTTPLVAGLQIVSSQVPQAGTPDALGFPTKAATGAANGDQIYQYVVSTQKYAVSSYDDLSDAFSPAPGSIGVGEAFFVKRSAAGSWTRTFNVNSP